MENMNAYASVAFDYLIDYGPKLLLALLTLFIGFWVIKILVKGMDRMMGQKEVDPSLRSFLRSGSSLLLKVLLVVSVVGMIGVEMTSFVAVIGAAGLAIGLALSGSLQNFAGGVMILLFKPFRVGDYIEAQAYSGTVSQILVFHTVLLSPDNKTIVIPNGPLSTGSLINYSTQPTRRMDLTFGIGYGDNIDQARSLLLQLAGEDARIQQDPEPFVAVSELADSSVNLLLRFWVKSADYWGVYFDLHEKVKKGFDKEKISIPFPQRDVHMYSHAE